MGGAKRSLGLIRRAAMPALALIVVGNFAGYAVAGPNGLLAWGGYHRDLERAQGRARPARGASATSCAIARRCSTRSKADPDMADELVRSDLGLVRPDEVIIPLE